MAEIPSRKYFLFALAGLLLLASYCLAQPETPSPWQAVGNDFVQEILSRGGSPPAVTVTFDNISSLSSPDQETVKKIILTAFRNAGVRLVKPDFATAEVRITFSEDWQSYVWVADIKQGPGNQMVITKVPRLRKTEAPRTPSLTIRKSLVWQQETPLLDFYSDGQTLSLLEPSQISVYGNDSGKWRVKQTLAVSHDHAWPRDLRGRMLINGTQITAFLPGTLCNGSTSPPAMQCRASDDPWQIDQNFLSVFFSPTRNFFTGVLAGHSAGESVPAFFSAASTQSGNTREWVFAGTDGRARLFINDLTAPWATLSDWGSNIAAVQSGCGTGWQILVSFPNDLTHADAIQAMEVQSREAVSVSSPVELSGPVLAFWPGENPQTAHAVVQSLSTGKYEAWNFSIGCN
jgi:hypothetical protein